jgi:hypothetical protein
MKYLITTLVFLFSAGASAEKTTSCQICSIGSNLPPIKCTAFGRNGKKVNGFDYSLTASKEKSSVFPLCSEHIYTTMVTSLNNDTNNPTHSYVDILSLSTIDKDFTKNGEIFCLYSSPSLMTDSYHTLSEGETIQPPYVVDHVSCKAADFKN